MVRFDLFGRPALRFAFFAGLTLTALSCTKLDTQGGPLDGNYVVSAWTCTSAPNILNALRVINANGVGETFDADFGTFTLSFSDGCIFSNAKSYAYPSGTTTFLSTYGATTCSGSCTSSQCTAAAAPSPSVTASYSYSLSGNVITATRTLAATDISAPENYGTYGCKSGDTETYTLTRQ